MVFEESAGASFVNEPPPPKENLRSCGNRGQPTGAPPRTSRLHRVKSVPTIPTRLDTTLFTGPREKVGFGSSCVRTVDGSQEGDEEVPGPGNYLQPASFQQDASSNPSFGKRGLGGFASKTSRFGPRSCPAIPIAGRGCPGPGAYDTASSVAAMKEKSDFGQAPTSAFATGVGKSRLPRNNSLPGPGHYSGTSDSIAAEAAHISAARSVFMSETRRGPLGTAKPGTNAAIPGPGEYQTVGELGLSELGAQVNAVFKEPSQRRIARVHRDLPAAEQRAWKVLGEFGPSVGRECGTGLKQMPGPGTYDLIGTVGRENVSVAMSGFSSFQPGTKRTNFLPQEINEKTGPGSYDLNLAPNARITAALSAFSSNTDRLKPELPQAPGPAYYSPQPPKSRSHRLNAAKLWLA